MVHITISFEVRRGFNIYEPHNVWRCANCIYYPSLQKLRLNGWLPKIACTCGNTMPRKIKMDVTVKTDEIRLSNIALDRVWVFSRIFMLTKVLAVISVHPCLGMEIRDNKINAAVNFAVYYGQI